MPSGTTTSLPDARSPGPKISSISFATNSDVVWTVAPRRTARRTIGTIARTSGVHSSGIADERAVVDADERRQPARWREVVRRVHDLRRLQPAVDAGRVVARPRGEEHARRDRDEARLGRHLVALLARAPAQRVGNEPRRGLEASQRVEDLGDDAADTGAQPEQRRDVDRDRRARVHGAQRSTSSRPRRTRTT